MGKKKIMIVDDEVAFTNLVRLNLQETGKFEVRVENKGTRAVLTAQQFKPDLILLDIIMPDMAGSDVARLLRSEEATKMIPIAFLTATVMKEETGKQGKHIGGYPFLAKPVSTEELVGFIEKLIK
ncbi:MAG: response regulator [Candidatus Omnitrophica bacterium]|nr:response regulator [Candidatus Omnitrophota bacterium]